MAKNVLERQLVAPGQVLFTLAEDLRKIEVHARIDEADVGRIAQGQPASFGFSAFPGRLFHGEVASIRKMPQIAEGIVTYVAVIVAGNDDLLLLPGMTAEIRIVVDTRDNALKVPRRRFASFLRNPVAEATQSPDLRPETRGSGD